MPKSVDCWCVYFARDPRDGAVVYVGITMTPDRRFGHHRRSRQNGITKLHEELELIGSGVCFEVMFSGLTKLQAERAEMRLAFLHTQIRRSRFLGCPIDLTKGAVGRFGPRPVKKNYERVICNSCGAEAVLKWSGNKYRGEWVYESRAVHACPDCKTLYERDRVEFDRRSSAMLYGEPAPCTP